MKVRVEYNRERTTYLTEFAEIVEMESHAEPIPTREAEVRIRSYGGTCNDHDVKSYIRWGETLSLNTHL
jgi:hypothetical protein